MDSILVFLYKYGLLSVCLIILIEYACFPVSSEIVLPFSGVVARINNINLVLLIMLSAICGIVGSSICYFIGRKLGDRCISVLKAKVSGASKPIDKSYEFVNKYGKKAVLICRVIPICRTYISFVSGALRQSYIQFVIFSGIGILIWNTILISLGYILGENYALVSVFYKKYKYIILICILIIIISFVVKKNKCTGKEQTKNTK